MGKWFIAEWREAWRFSSVWVAAAGFSVLVAWNQMPSVVRAHVPDAVEYAIGGTLWLAVLIARITNQPRSQAKIDAKRAAAKADDYSDWADKTHG